MNISIIGVGHIGGSLARALRSRNFGSRFIGFDKNSNHARVALQLGLIDEVSDFKLAINKADLVILAIPVDQAKNEIRSVLDLIGEKVVVMDVGSTKQGICESIREHPRRKRYVATHPIAGTENSGPHSALADLFQNKVSILCEVEESDPDARELVEKLYGTLNMKILYMGSQEHDLHVAYVSHLSHVSSYTLGLTVLEIEKSEKTIFDLAGSGFESTVRLAKSSPSMWAPIFNQNAHHLSQALGAYIENLKLFKKMIDQGDSDRLYQLMEESNDIRRILDGIQLNEKELEKLGS